MTVTDLGPGRASRRSTGPVRCHRRDYRRIDL